MRTHILSTTPALATALFLLAFSHACAAAGPAPAPAHPVLTEHDKIERLIAAVHDLHDAVFIRKGSEYDAAIAAKFLRGKWDLWKEQVKTARDFVTMASAGNFGTGDPYLIKFKDGHTVKSGEFLTQHLTQLEAPTPPPHHPTRLIGVVMAVFIYSLK